ncbi:dihydrodipicolinate synthase family protein [Roseitranquillus sediminis]|uniref:dihydrodipicolinate synthase family protein n=1 Tax=Roseitranquillus sediminis TaxID=2809051 RepID=UPI001D0C0CF2|nr:dihydrodipicolinate synthase family protein [Roseitranquillus sediminis]MBM9594178.1 dihydrodipicolinate synthase family protein [Roseitranquillus sediminis]
MPMSGVLTPVITPFDEELRPDEAKLVTHCRWMLENDVGLALFGTNSEANSLSLAERKRLLEVVVGAGLPANRMMPGTGTNSLPETIELTRHAVEHGVGGVLMLPPFYYKGVSDDGLFDYFSRVIEGVGDDRLRIYLYHIPPVAQIPLGLDLIERLLDAHPGIIAGVKDSGGDWSHTEAMIQRFGSRGFEVFAGSEVFLLKTLRTGGVGCISATANVNPAAIAAVARDWQADDADARQADLDRVRAVFQSYPMIPALKAATAHHSGDAGWRRVRPPLVQLDEKQLASFLGDLEEIGFSMPGLPEAEAAKARESATAG